MAVQLATILVATHALAPHALAPHARIGGVGRAAAAVHGPRMMALSTPLSELTVDKVRAYTRPDEMIEYLTGMTEQSEDMHLRRMLATAYASASEPQLAEPHVDAALEADPKDVEMRFLKGVAREHAGEVEEALDAYGTLPGLGRGCGDQTR